MPNPAEKVMLVYQMMGITPLPRRRNVPRKTDAEKMLGPKGAADAVKKRVTEIKKLSDKLTTIAVQMARAMKNVAKLGPNSGRCINLISSGGVDVFDVRIDLNTVGNFTREEKLVILDQITELAIEYMRREAAATYDEIQKLGKEL